MDFFILRIFYGRFDTSGSMIPHSVPEIEGGSPERDGGEGEGLVLAYSSSWMSVAGRKEDAHYAKYFHLHTSIFILQGPRGGKGGRHSAAFGHFLLWPKGSTE